MRHARIGEVEVVVDDGSPLPPYQQVVGQVVAAVAAGDLPAGTRLPTVRALAQELGVAANTVAKAYRQLEAEGHVETRGRNGTVVLGRETDGLTSEVDSLVAAARRRGLGLDELLGLVRRAW